MLTTRIGFPSEAVQYFEQCYLTIEKNPNALQNLHRAKECYLQKTNPEYKNFLGQIAEETGIHLHSVNMVFILFCASYLKEQYEKSGFSEEFFYDNMRDVTNKLTECKNVNGIWGTWALDWLENLFYMRCFKLGRLQFKKGICELKEPYKGIVKAGDTIVECHIPMGEPLDIQSVKCSLNRAYEFYKMDFPDKKVIFTCKSWLLYTPLISELPESSNIKKFSSLFDIVELEADEQNSNFWRIFNVRWPQDINTIKGENTLQKVMIEHIKSGGSLGAGYGVILLEGGSEK